MKNIISHINMALIALIPYYGKGARLRLFLRLREFFRKHHLTFWGECLKSFIQTHYGMELSCGAKISPKVKFMHTVGVVIGDGVVIHDGVTIYSGVTLGRKDINKEEYPIIGENSVLCTNCTILGGIIIDKNTIVGANSLVINDLIGGGTFAGTPAHKLS